MTGFDIAPVQSPGLKRAQIIIPALTGLRVVLASMIFFYHWFFHYVTSLPLLIRAPTEVGYVCVPVFFALSGFLITHRTYKAFQQRQLSFGVYLLRRLVRIYPLYAAVLTLFVVALGRPENMMPKGVRAFVAVYTMTQTLFPSLVHIGTTVGWTLTAEVLFYLIAPTLMRWFGRGKTFGLVVFRALTISLVAIALGLLLARLPPLRLMPDTLIGAPEPFIMHYSLFGHLSDFVVGMVAAFALCRHSTLAWLRQHVHLAIGSGFVGALVCIIALDLLETELGSPTNRLLAFGVAFFASIIIAAMVTDERQTNPITWILSRRPVVYLGSISYALFLIQLTEPCQWMYWIFLGELCHVENRIWRAVWLYGIATILAIVLFEGIEKPAHRLFTRMIPST